MLGPRLRRWPSINLTLDQRLEYIYPFVLPVLTNDKDNSLCNLATHLNATLLIGTATRWQISSEPEAICLLGGAITHAKLGRL